jgi:hypothetical protein
VQHPQYVHHIADDAVDHDVGWPHHDLADALDPTSVVELWRQPGILRLGLELEIQIDRRRRVVLSYEDHDGVAIRKRHRPPCQTVQWAAFFAATAPLVKAARLAANSFLATASSTLARGSSIEA